MTVGTRFWVPRATAPERASFLLLAPTNATSRPGCLRPRNELRIVTAGLQRGINQRKKVKMASSFTNSTRASLFGAFTLALLNTAVAQSECTDDASCPAGHTCQTSSYERCDWSCDEGSTATQGCTATACEKVVYSACQRAQCDTDADCGADMLCQQMAGSTCSPAPACQPGEACEPPSECTQTEVKQCVYREELPCQADADCGDGYDCVPAVMCSCAESTQGPSTAPTAAVTATGGASASTGVTETSPAVPVTTATAGGDARPSPDCECSPTGVNTCQMQNIECESDNDCPADWECVFAPSAPVIDGPSTASNTAHCYPSAPTVAPPPTPHSGQSTQPPVAPDAGVEDGSSTQTPMDGEHHSLGGLFALFGCSVGQVARTNGAASWALLAAGLGTTLLRRRRR